MCLFSETSDGDGCCIEAILCHSSTLHFTVMVSGMAAAHSPTGSRAVYSTTHARRPHPQPSLNNHHVCPVVVHLDNRPVLAEWWASIYDVDMTLDEGMSLHFRTGMNHLHPSNYVHINSRWIRNNFMVVNYEQNLSKKREIDKYLFITVRDMCINRAYTK